MKWFLGFFLAIGIWVTVGDARCFFQKNKQKESTKGCVQDGKLHEFGTTWQTEDCLTCSCSEMAIFCCSITHSPVGYDAKKCKTIFNKDTCSFKVVEKTDPFKECEVHSWVG